MADTSGEGLYITILVKVFTDAGYTTESMLYGRIEVTYLVQQRLSIALAGGGGGPGISYKKIREIIEQEVRNLKLPQPKTIIKYNTVREVIEVDLSPIMKALDRLGEDVGNIRIPEANEVNLAPLIKSIQQVQEKIEGIKIPETDVSPLMDVLNEIKRMMEDYKLSLEKVQENTKKAPLPKKDEVKEKTKRRRERFFGTGKLKRAFI